MRWDSDDEGEDDVSQWTRVSRVYAEDLVCNESFCSSDLDEEDGVKPGCCSPRKLTSLVDPRVELVKEFVASQMDGIRGRIDDLVQDTLHNPVCGGRGSAVLCGTCSLT